MPNLLDMREDSIAWPLIVPFFIALALVLSAAVSRPGKLGHLLGGPDWSFTGSWASTITAIGGLLTLALGAGLLPEGTGENPDAAGARRITDVDVVGLSLMFGVLLVVAPFLFLATTKRFGANKYFGRVFGYWTSSLATLTAVFGQLIVLESLVIPMIRDANAIDRSLEIVLGITVIVAGIAVATYAYRTMIWTVDDKATAPPTDTSVAGMETYAGGERWSLL